MDSARLEIALRHAGVKAMKFLGEGAWHYAWKVHRGCEELVLRIPKKVAYGKSILFNEELLKAEYIGTKLYYQNVNRALDGAAPQHFEFHISSELTYTLETYGGERINLHTMSDEKALQTGKELGQIHRKTDEVPHSLNGLGYLAWTQEKGLHGTMSGDAKKILKEESEDYLAAYQVLCEAHPEFEGNTISEAIQLAVKLREKAFVKPVLVNQDASPENILMNGNQVCLIDPYPSLYYSKGMAGNFMNLYETYFIALAKTERYRSHRFEACQDQLKLIAAGFIDGYSAGNPKIIGEVRGEQLLQLLDTAHSHLQLVSEESLEEKRVRYGSKQEIENRLNLLSSKLKELAVSQLGPISFSLAENMDLERKR